MMTVLNEDTFSIIVSFLSPRDAWRLAATSCSLYSIAKRHALSVVELRTSKKLTQAHEYLLGDVPNRLHWVRELKVSVDEFFIPQLASRLADIVENAVLLTRISIRTPLDAWIWSESRVGRALENLEGLQDVELHGIGQRSLGVVSKMRSRPRRLLLRGETDRQAMTRGPNAKWVTGPIDLAALLTSISHHDNLQMLDLGLRQSVPVDRLNEAEAPVRHLSSIRHLNFSALSDDAPSLHDLLRAFPNVRTLGLQGQNKLCVGPEPASQECWPQLDFVHGTIMNLTYWGLRCPVHHLNLSIFNPPIPTDRNDSAARLMRGTRLILSAVEDMSPVVLSLDRLSPYPPYYATDALLWMRIVDLAPRLRVLDLDLNNFWPSAKFREWMGKIPPVLRRSRVVCIQIRVRDEVAFTQTPAQLAECVPSLRYIAILSTVLEPAEEDDVPPRGFRQDPLWRWWRVVEIEGQRTVQPITTEMGEYVATHLHSPEYDYMSDLDDLANSSCL